mgnify:CR=1 FL=1
MAKDKPEFSVTVAGSLVDGLGRQQLRLIIAVPDSKKEEDRMVLVGSAELTDFLVAHKIPTKDGTELWLST